MHGENPLSETVNQQAAKWFAAREAGDMTAEEEAMLAEWLAADPAHVQAFNRAQAVWQNLDSAMLRPASQPHRPHSRRWARPPRVRARHWVGGAVAASLALFLAVESDIPTRLRADVMTATGDVREVRLPDGSIATLNTASAIAYSHDGRTVRLLKGEAAFRVAPDPAHPFSVVAAGGASTALGTRFIVRRTADGALVTVTEHSVRVAATGQASVVREGEAISYGQEGLERPHPVVVADADAWVRGRIRVVNRPLGDVVAELNRYYRGYIRVVGADVAQRPVSGTFDIHDPVGAVDVIQRTLGISSTRVTNRLIFLHG